MKASDHEYCIFGLALKVRCLLKLFFEQKGKRTHGHGQQCGDCCKGCDIRDENGDGKIL